MARNGSGSYSAPTNSWNPAVASTTIDESDFNTLLSDLETALTNSIANDGQTTTSAAIPFAQGIETDTISEDSANSGVTVDGVLLKDNDVEVGTSGEVRTDTIAEKTAAAGVTIDSVVLKDGGATLTGALTGVTNLTLADDIIHAGDTDNLISFDTDTQDFQTGGSSRLDISDSGVRLGGANARVTTILDEDDMSSDSATALATQQSIKAYVDTASAITLGTEQATTSGTEIDFTSIPAGTKRITIMFEGVSLSGTDDFLVQIGDAGGIETTGYLSSSGQIQASPAASTSATGFNIKGKSAGTSNNGICELVLKDSANFTWASGHSMGVEGSGVSIAGGGTKSLSAELTQVRITRTGTDSFDAGSINIMYE